MQNQKKKLIKLWLSGAILLSSFLFTGCAHSFGRKKPEPAVEWCKAYPDGGWRCLQKDDTFVDKEPEEMIDYMALPIDDAEVYRKWCVRRRE